MEKTINSLHELTPSSSSSSSTSSSEDLDQEITPLSSSSPTKFSFDHSSSLPPSSSSSPSSSSLKSKYHLYSLLFFIFIILALFVGLLSYFLSKSSYPPDGITNSICITDYGKVLGQDSKGIIGYSNCNEYFISEEYNWINNTIYSGMKWQCVEYSRRWLIEIEQVTYDSIDYAYQIWDLNKVTSITGDNKEYPFISYPTDTSTTPPKVGCLLIYSSTDYLEPTGHVAVIVGVENDSSLLIGEQNWFNDIWLGPNYARNLTLSVTDGKYSINDQYIIGWKCVEK